MCDNKPEPLVTLPVTEMTERQSELVGVLKSNHPVSKVRRSAWAELNEAYGSKYCFRCDRLMYLHHPDADRPASFAVNRALPDGRQSVCIKCDSKRAYAKQRADSYAPSALLNLARKRAKKRAAALGVPWHSLCTITREDLANLIEKQVRTPDAPFGRCPVFGMPLTYRSAAVNGGVVDSSMTLDSLDGSGEYHADRIVLLSHRANAAKLNLSFSELLTLALYARGDRTLQPNQLRHDEEAVAWTVRCVTKRGWPSHQKAYNHTGMADISPDQLETPKDCPGCGTTLKYGTKHSRYDPAKATLDRFDPTAGYGNLTNLNVLCRRCNAAFSNLNPDELLVLVEWYSIELTKRGLQPPNFGSDEYERLIGGPVAPHAGFVYRPAPQPRSSPEQLDLFADAA